MTTLHPKKNASSQKNSSPLWILTIVVDTPGHNEDLPNDNVSLTPREIFRSLRDRKKSWEKESSLRFAGKFLWDGNHHICHKIWHHRDAESLEEDFGSRKDLSKMFRCSDYRSDKILATENTTWAPKKVGKEGKFLVSGKSSLVKYHNLDRNRCLFWHYSS